MSAENIRPFRKMMDAYARSDKAAWEAFIDPEVETIPTPTWPEPGPFIGPDAAWDFYRQFEQTLPLREEYEISELIEAGDSLFICQQAQVRGHASGAEVVFRLWGVHTFSDGRIVKTRWFNERSEALEAAGLSG
jgi:ketosteroid isomerase-like protein